MNAFATALCLLALILAPGAWAATPPWVPPLAGQLVVRRAFEPPAVRWATGHRGVDLAASPGATVLAAGAGTVTFAGLLAGRGVLVVTHGALRTTYEPVLPLLPRGTDVGAGDVVALLGSGHAGPAVAGEALLHWGLLRGDTYLDPLSLLRRGPSRLVPVAPAPPAPPAPNAADAAEAPATALADLVPAGAPPPSPPGRAGPATAFGGVSVAALAAFGTWAGVSRAGRRASRGAGGRPSCASGRCGSRSRPGPGRSPPG